MRPQKKVPSFVTHTESAACNHLILLCASPSSNSFRHTSYHTMPSPLLVVVTSRIILCHRPCWLLLFLLQLLGIGAQRLELDPPADRSIITLWMGGIEPDTSEEDLRAVIYPYGQIASIHMVRSAKCAFVEYADREAAEQAASQLYKALMVNGRPVNVNWAKPRVEAAAAAAGGALGDMADGDASAAPVLLPPPGMERAPASAYCLPGMAPPPPPPPLPTGAPPSKRQKVDGASSAPAPPPARSLAATGFSANFSGYGDSDDEESGAGAAAGAGASNSSCSSAAGGGSSAGGGRGAAAKPSGSFAHKPPMMKYPSMNPARMGSKA